MLSCMLARMRTTIRIDDDLLKEARRVAVESGKTLTEVVEDSLRESFARRKPSAPTRAHIDLPVFRGSGLKPGINLDKTSELLDLLDQLESEDDSSGR
jgi:hypothetical protein